MEPSVSTRTGRQHGLQRRIRFVSRARTLSTLLNLNRQLYDSASGTKLYPDLGNIQWNGFIGHSYYDSLQVQLQRRLVNGLQYSVAYTWAHTIDNSPGTLDQQSDRVDYYRLFAERANSNLDVRHRFVATAIYELPFGRGKRMGGDWNGFACRQWPADGK